MKELSLSAGRRRALSVIAIVLVAAAGALADVELRTLHLQPLATLCVVALTVFTELPTALVFALAMSAVYSAAGVVRPVDAAEYVDIALFATINLLAAYVGSAIKVKVAEISRLNTEVTGELKARKQLADIALARSALHEYEQRYLSVGEFIPFGTWHTRPDGSLHMSQSFLNLVGMTLDEIKDGGWSKGVVPEDARRFFEAWEQREQSDGTWEHEYRVRGVDGKLYTILSRGTRLTGSHGESLGWVGVSFDITDRKRAEDRLEFLAEAGRLLALSLDPETTLDRIAKLCVPRLGDWCAIDVLQDNGTFESVAVNHNDAQRVALVRELRDLYPPSGEENGLRRVVRDGQPLLFSDVTDATLESEARDKRHLEMLRRLEIASVMIVPLIARGNTLGAVTFVNAESKRHYQQDDLEFAEILCRRAALAYDNARLFARQQRVAEALQTASLPTALPDVPGLRICATYRAGEKESEIGGDWYDAFELPDGELALSVGDVAGKGLKAAVAMGAVRQAFRAAAFEGAGPAEILNRSNKLLCHQNIGMVTAAIAILHVDTGKFSFATAGHPPILCVRAGVEPRRFTTEGLPLGVLPEYEFTQDSAIVDRGSLLVMYTDGLLENTRDIRAGELAVGHAVEREIAAPSANPAESIVGNVLATSPTDDVAALTVHVLPESFDHLDVTLPAEPESARIIRRGLRRLCIAGGLTEQRTLNVLVAAGEAVSNAIQHAYGVEGGKVRAKAYREDASIVVEISDTGKWRAARQDGHGRGITVMRKLMDYVSIQSTADGTRAVLRIANGQTM